MQENNSGLVEETTASVTHKPRATVRESRRRIVSTVATATNICETVAKVLQ